MDQSVSKTFTNVRYWRYVFTPLVFVILFFGIFVLYTGDSSSRASFPSLTNIMRRTADTGSLNSVLAELEKLRA